MVHTKPEFELILMKLSKKKLIKFSKPEYGDDFSTLCMSIFLFIRLKFMPIL